MAKTVLSSPVFDVSPLAGHLEDIHRAIPPNAKPLRWEGPSPAGAFVFVDLANVRFVVQYQIETDTWAGRFDVLVETPSSDD